MLILEASDLGDAAVDGAGEPVSIVDRLPVGVTPTHVVGEGGGSFSVGINGSKEATRCEILAQTVSCTYDGPLLSYERLMIAISVQVRPGSGSGVAEASVSGGGAATVGRRGALALEGPAPFGAENYELSPEEEGGAPDTQAGSHPFQLTTTLSFASRALPVINTSHREALPEVQPVTLAKDLRFDLPPGLVGNPTPLPKCSLAVFLNPASEKCPDDTAVGVATPITTNLFSPPYVPFAEAVTLYDLEPGVGEPARFGFDTQVGPVVLDTSVRTGGDYGVVVTVPDIPDDIGFIGSQVTFWGVPADPRHDTARGSCLDEHGSGVFPNFTQLEFSCPTQEAQRPFLIMPTSCEEPWQTTVESDPWSNIGHWSAPRSYTFAGSEGRPLREDGCNHLSFDPSISVAPDTSKASTPSGLTVDVHVDQSASLDPQGLAEGTVRDTTVALPAGVALNPAGGDGLLSCSLGQIALESGEESTCPEAAKVGLVEVGTPLLPNPLKGAAYIAAQEDNPFGSVLALYIVVYDPVSGVRVKLAGEIKPDPLTGQLVSTFHNTPQLPFEDLKLQFFGGSRAPLGTPAVCSSYMTTATMTPWSAQTAEEIASPPFQITSGPNGSPCADPLPFAPELQAGSLNLQAGAFTPFTTTMTREDGNQNLSALQIHMPPGLSGLLRGVELCPEPQASQGLCGPGSLIGETTVSVGLGGAPYTVTGGKVYITGPYNGQGPCAQGTPGCAPFGLSIVNPAKAGPFDLAKTKGNHPACDCVLVRAKLEVDPITAAITVTSDATGPDKIPTILEGIPLQIKHVNVTIDRPGFTFNPTDCEPQKITGTLTSSEGASSSLNVPFQVTNCATLGFKPQFSVSTSAHTSRADGAELHVKVANPHGSFGSQANLRSVKVDLPKQLPSRLTTLQRACPHATFEANPAGCPSESIVGHAVVHTQLIPVPLTGPAYFVSYGGEEFPKLIMVLQGYGVTVELVGNTFIKKGVTSSTFRSTPDTPFESFELTLPEGRFSALAANGDLCTAGKTIAVTKRVKRRVHGRLKTVTVKVKEKGPGLVMPTALTAQNGAVVHQGTKIAVTGCPVRVPARGRANARKTRHRIGRGR